jgi:hypothetical protein
VWTTTTPSSTGKTVGDAIGEVGRPLLFKSGFGRGEVRNIPRASCQEAPSRAAAWVAVMSVS